MHLISTPYGSCRPPWGVVYFLGAVQNPLVRVRIFLSMHRAHFLLRLLESRLPLCACVHIWGYCVSVSMSRCNFILRARVSFWCGNVSNMCCGFRAVSTMLGRAARGYVFAFVAVCAFACVFIVLLRGHLPSACCQCPFLSRTCRHHCLLAFRVFLCLQCRCRHSRTCFGCGVLW